MGDITDATTGTDTPPADPRDVAELARLRDEVATLAEAVAARDAFLAVAAHELRNPMTPIVGQVQLLRRGLAAGTLSPERLATGLERLGWMTDHFIRRATTLLDVSRLTTGTLGLRPAPLRLAPLLAEVAARHAPIAALSRCAVSVEAPEALTALADALAVEQIVDNLLSNALKYAAGAPIRLRAAADGPHAVIEVADGGPGIPEESRRRIFDRFERAVAAGGFTGGFGVGLWIVSQYAAAMGGSVAVGSSPGEGSTFTVRLPLHAGEGRG